MSTWKPCIWVAVWMMQVIGAQAKPARIEGQIHHYDGEKVALVPAPVTGEFSKQTLTIYRGGLFGADVAIERPQLAVLQIGNRFLRLFLTPGCFLHIDADDLLFPQGVRFGGDAGPDNTLLQQYYELHPPASRFDREYYKILGHPFPYVTEMDGYMKLYHATDFAQWVEKKDSLNRDLLASPLYDRASNAFRQTLRAEVEAYPGYALLSYALLYGKRERITPDTFGEKISFPRYERADGFYAKQYLLLYCLYAGSDMDTPGSQAGKCYSWASAHYQAPVLEYLLSEIIIDGIRHGDEESFDLYEQYAARFPDSPYLKRLEKILFEDLAAHYGEPAPDFTLEGLDGKTYSLSQFAGKVVHIDFWASWCAPCLRQLDHMEQAVKDASPDVVFLTISVDADKLTWRRTIRRRGYSGIHLYAGRHAKVNRLYHLRGVPARFIVRKDGRLAPYPKDSDAAGIVKLLNRLSL